MRTERIAAATGAMYVVAILVGNSLEGEPADGGGEGLLAALREGRTATESVGLVLEGLGLVALLVFAGYLFSVLRRTEGQADWAAAGAFGAGLLTVAIKLSSAAPALAAVYRPDDLSPVLATLLEDMNGAGFVLTGFALGVFVALAAAAALSARVLPRWLTIAGLVVGVLTVAAGLAGIVDPVRYVPVPFLLGLAWVLAVSVALTVRTPDRATRTGDGVAPEVPATA